ncbi:MAG: hypothetical protein V1934_07630 [Methanobacteriota archaeon]
MSTQGTPGEGFPLWEKYQRNLDEQTDLKWRNTTSIKETSLCIFAGLLLLLLGNIALYGYPYIGQLNVLGGVFYFFIAGIAGYMLSLTARKKSASFFIISIMCVSVPVIAVASETIPITLGITKNVIIREYYGRIAISTILSIAGCFCGAAVALSHFEQDGLFICCFQGSNHGAWPTTLT